ncbi:uncharacterized protein OCT59_020717 [Rhizophagus irregularis]|uniref:uncharacterized protein n=1 Tax=Rhizophagus irregularis TaxID=588596 RepID=UPI0033214BA2|nr:hypothetical protein OCT59_020717 [Rhizophagus irregularis]
MAPTLRVTLIKPGTIVPELHYGPYSFYWWIISNENETLFPIRLGQQTKVCLNKVDFILTIQTGSGNNKLMPMYCCQSGLHVVTEPRYQAMGWNDKNILKTLKQDIQHIPVTVNVENCIIFIYGIGTSSREKWRYAGSGFQSSLLHMLFDYHVKRRTLANANWKYFFTSWVKTENPIIELEPALHAIYPKGYEFSERELSAWQTMLKAVGATNITPWLSEESKRQLWTKSPNEKADKVAFAALYKSGFLTSIPKNMPNATHTFWMCFERAHLLTTKKLLMEKDVYFL